MPCARSAEAVISKEWELCISVNPLTLDGKEHFSDHYSVKCWGIFNKTPLRWWMLPGGTCSKVSFLNILSKCGLITEHRDLEFNCCAQLKSSIKWCNWIAANFVKWVWQAGDGGGIPWRFYCLELLQVKQQLQMERGFLLWLINSTAVYFGGPCTFLWSWTCHWIASETTALFLTFYQKYPQLLLVRHTEKTFSCFFLKQMSMLLSREGCYSPSLQCVVENCIKNHFWMFLRPKNLQS